jgi:hypothetical protein
MAWLMAHSSKLMAHSSWLMVHGSWLMAHLAHSSPLLGSWLMAALAHLAWLQLMAHGSRLMAHGSRLMALAHGSRLRDTMAHGSRLMAHGSCNNNNNNNGSQTMGRPLACAPTATTATTTLCFERRSRDRVVVHLRRSVNIAGRNVWMFVHGTTETPAPTTTT